MQYANSYYILLELHFFTIYMFSSAFYFFTLLIQGNSKQEEITRCQIRHTKTRDHSHVSSSRNCQCFGSHISNWSI